MNGRRIKGDNQWPVNRREPGGLGVLPAGGSALLQGPPTPPSALRAWRLLPPIFKPPCNQGSRADRESEERRRLGSSPRWTARTILAEPLVGDARGCTPSCPAGRVHDTPARRQQTGAPGQLRRQRDISGVASTLGRNPYGSCIHESAGAGSRRRPMAATSQSPQVHFLFS